MLDLMLGAMGSEVWSRVGRRSGEAGIQDQEHVLTFHLLLAKFFLICSLTDW